jgi:ABC-type glycerol-3-phosphate transport system substrate-binding protein
MTVLDFSVNVHFLESVRVLRKMLDQFQRQTGREVILHLVPSRAAWRSLIYYGFYQRGADVSEIGTTWVSQQAGIGALRALSPTEVAELGSQEAFFPSLWQPDPTNEGKMWSVPFLGDVRLIYYWRDMLSRTGTHPENAFDTPDNFAETLHKLARVNMTAWATQTQSDTHDIVYQASSWVWGTGGDFISPDGRSTAFNKPEARKGLSAYFGLNAFMPQQLQPLNLHQLADLFCERRVAAIISGPWVMNYLARNIDDSDLLEQVGVAQPPGPAFVGGTQLAIWKHAGDDQNALELMKYLLTPEAQRTLPPLTGMLPVMRSVAESPDYSARFSHYDQFLYGLRHGRNPAILPYWGLIEEHLATAFHQIWGELLENPNININAVLDRVLNPLSTYLDRILAN